MLQRFYFSLVVCKTVSIETLVAQIQKKIRKESVIAESELPAVKWGSYESKI